ncbi:MAG: hypothetical protein AB7P14_22895 [Blastocatellales bacterium]
MAIFLIILTIYVATLIYLNIKIKPDSKQLPAHLEVGRKILSLPGNLLFLVLTAIATECLFLFGRYVLYLLGYAEHPFPK